VCELLPPRLCVAVGPLQVGSASAAYLHSFEPFFYLQPMNLVSFEICATTD
jgi:hypothetical protein